jgi:UDP-2-acetamido-2,6-beta-L-arabino-hexul-4-ose reductase
MRYLRPCAKTADVISKTSRFRPPLIVGFGGRNFEGDIANRVIGEEVGSKKEQVRIDRLMTSLDPRGIVFEPIGNDDIKCQKNIHVVISEPGAVRGNHYHLRGTETVVVVGPALIVYQENDVRHSVEVPPGQVYKFVIPPKVVHAIKNTGDKSNILVAFNTVGHDPRKPDHVKAVVID